MGGIFSWAASARFVFSSPRFISYARGTAAWFGRSRGEEEGWIGLGGGRGCRTGVGVGGRGAREEGGASDGARVLERKRKTRNGEGGGGESRAAMRKERRNRDFDLRGDEKREEK